MTPERERAAGAAIMAAQDEERRERERRVNEDRRGDSVRSTGDRRTEDRRMLQQHTPYGTKGN